MLKDHHCSDLTTKLVGRQVKLAGFVHSQRNHGQIIFFDLRDSSGLVQVVFDPEDQKIYQQASKLTPESVVQVVGKVQKRPQGMENKKITSGKIEIKAKKLNILAKAKTPVFEVNKDTRLIDEKKRLSYRYLDLRSKRLADNLRLRHQVITFIRQFLNKQGFLEIETPYLTKGTPEGAREYLVPSRLHPDQYYVLPQSPQQFKQLLMVGGIEKYYQIARCFRDEDPRGDRQQEFTQLDLEMAYITQEDILILIEQLLSELIEELFPDKKITKLPFPRITYRKAMKEYQTDAPDIRKDPNNPDELGFVWVTDFPLMEWDAKGKQLQSSHHPFTKPRKEDIDLLEKEPTKVLAEAYDIVLNGTEVGGGSIRISDYQLQKRVFKVLGLTDKVIEKRFGQLLKAFQYGAPPHGGIAPGLDRLVMELAGEKNIREVIAFPKTGDGRDLMMGAPSKISPEQLREVGIKKTKS
jgi:aspartyl-tRNA synthetase